MEIILKCEEWVECVAQCVVAIFRCVQATDFSTATQCLWSETSVQLFFYVNDLETKMILWERGGTSYVCLGIIIPFCQENVFFSLLAEGICAVSYLGKMSFYLFFFFKLILKRSTIVYLFFLYPRGLFIIHNLVLLSHCGCFFLSIWSFKTPYQYICYDWHRPILQLKPYCKVCNKDIFINPHKLQWCN